MGNTAYFERLVESTRRIARHSEVPGKQEAVDLCLEDIADLSDTGRITADQAVALREVLLGGLVRPAALSC
jgi:hypothetical protein